MAKKSYNPLKMWGSYVGAVIGFLLALVSSLYSTMLIPIAWIMNTFSISSNIYWAIYYLLSIIFYFLLGWGIHSLIRKLRK